MAFTDYLDSRFLPHVVIIPVFAVKTLPKKTCKGSRPITIIFCPFLANAAIFAASSGVLRTHGEGTNTADSK